MEARNSELPPQPPGVIRALISGFNAVAGNISVIFFPITLDIFLWLGPHLKMYRLMQPYLGQMSALRPSSDAPAAVDPAQFWRAFNLFSFVRTFPVGIFSLLSSFQLFSVDMQSLLKKAVDAVTPLGPRPDVEVDNILVLFVVVAGLVFVGWLLGSLYFYAVARVALGKTERLPSLGRALLQGILLNGSWAFLGITFGLPAVVVVAMLILFSPGLAVVAQIVFSLLIMWLAVPIFFSAYGVFAEAQNAFVSIWNSFRILRFGLPPLGWFALLAVIINQGMDLVWSIPPSESWMTLIGIFGHAFISTGLLAASFIFYRDLSSWVEEALQWLKKHQITSARA